MKIFNIFKRKKLTVAETDNRKLFNCHYCGKGFEVTAKMVFPMSVPKLYSDYYFQGIGVKCPHCLKDCVYG